VISSDMFERILLQSIIRKILLERTSRTVDSVGLADVVSAKTSAPTTPAAISVCIVMPIVRRSGRSEIAGSIKQRGIDLER